MRYPLRRKLERMASDRWARRGLRILLRAAWLGLSLVCIGLGLHMLFGWQVPLDLLGAVGLGFVVIGALLLLRRRMSAPEVARRLDQRFGLDEQLSTALEVGARGAPEGVEVHLLEQAFATTGQVQQHVNRNQRQPWAELAALLALALVTLGLFLLNAMPPVAAQPAPEQLPPLVPPPEVGQEEVPPDAANQQPQGGQGEGQQQEAQASSAAAAGIDEYSAGELADALRDQSATRPAADALDQGDTAGAAQRLREVADQADQLSDGTRRDLSDELRDAAAAIEPHNPDLANQVRESAQGLQQEGQSTAEALENLAESIEGLSGDTQQAQQEGQPQEGQPQGESQQQDGQQPGAGPGGGGAGNSPLSEQREQPDSSERLGVDGVPLELESDGDGGAPGEGEDPADSSGVGNFAPGDGEETDDQTVQVADDPLRIPADLRDVVQEYFSPTE